MVVKGGRIVNLASCQIPCPSSLEELELGQINDNIPAGEFQGKLMQISCRQVGKTRRENSRWCACLT